jgi:hypothetical protein
VGSIAGISYDMLLKSDVAEKKMRLHGGDPSDLNYISILETNQKVYYNGDR